MNAVNLAVLLISVAIAACTSNEPDAPSTARSGETPVDGTVRQLSVEGGCWIIDTAQGRVEPLDLPERFRVDGLAVRVTLRDAPEVMSVCQVGTPKHVDAITARDSD